jgi:hypothetical protein
MQNTYKKKKQTEVVRISHLLNKLAATASKKNLSKYQPKEHIDPLTVTGFTLICLFVWFFNTCRPVCSHYQMQSSLILNGEQRSRPIY